MSGDASRSEGAPGSDPALVRRLAADYASSAREYAEHWGPMILPLALPLLDRLPLAAAGRVLDVCTGTGALLPHLIDAAPGDALALGVDRSPGMVRQARNRPLARVAVMDARGLALPSGLFDVATMVFGLFHIPHPADAVGEMRRALRPGGTAGLVTWSDEDPGLPGAELWTAELDRAGAGPDPRAPEVRRHDLVDRPEKLVALLEGAGFGLVEAWKATFARPVTPDAIVTTQALCGSASRRLATLPAEERESCVLRVRERASGLGATELVWRPAVVHATGVAR